MTGIPAHKACIFFMVRAFLVKICLNNEYIPFEGVVIITYDILVVQLFVFSEKNASLLIISLLYCLI